MRRQTLVELPPAAVWRGSVAVWAALMALFALTLALAFVPLGRWNGVLSYGIAAAKGLVVAVLFMRLKTASGIVRLAALAGLFWLGTLFAMTLTDYPFRQDGERVRTQPSERAFSASDGLPDETRR